MRTIGILRKKNVPYYLFVLALCFSDIAGNGNLNLLYFFGLIAFFCNLKRISSYRLYGIIFLPFVFMVAAEYVFSTSKLDSLRILVYSAKMLINVSLMIYIKQQMQRINLTKIVKMVYLVFSFLLILALITYGKDYLWRINDAFNSFSKTRLEFLYSEPSVLGVVTSILIIICFYRYFFVTKDKKLLTVLICFSAILVLTFSLSAIAYTFISIVLMLLFQKGTIKGKHVGILILIIVAFVIVMNTENPISSRLYAVIAGDDGSFNYRWNASMATLPIVLHNTNNWGLGLGNMNTELGIGTIYSIGGMDYKFANSFPYFIAENGVLGFVYIVFLVGVLIVSVNRKQIRFNREYSLRIALLAYAIISQIAGGYFTDPLIWCVYGLISSDTEIFKIKEGING